MAITSKFLRDIEAEARPIIERQMNDAKIIAGLRDVVAAAGGDWGALKALIKARVEDDNDETGEGKRVRKVREKADCIVAYDDMLGSNMNEKNFSASRSYAEASRGPDDTVAEPQAPQAATVSHSNPQEPISSPAADSPASTSSPEPGSLSDADVPAFLKPEQRKSIADYRPNCLNPDACGATGLQHCYTCRKAMEAASETEAA